MKAAASDSVELRPTGLHRVEIVAIDGAPVLDLKPVLGPVGERR